MAVYGYVRVSTQDQANEGQSLGVQQRQLEGYAMMQGWTVTQTFSDGGVSGSVPLQQRPAGNALLGILKAGDVVIVAKLDRMFRSSIDALQVQENFKANGIALHMIDLGGDVVSGSIAKLVFTILAAVAEAERDRIRERIATVKQDQKKRNRYLGGIVPFGFVVVDGELVADAGQQAALLKAKGMRTAGATFRACQEAIADAGYKLSIGGLHNLLAA